MISRIITLATLAILVASQARGAQKEVRAIVRLRSEAVAQADVLTLEQIAEVRATDEQDAARLRAISLGYAPAIGAARQLGRAEIARAIMAAGFRSEEVQFDGPSCVIVRRASQLLDEELIRASAERAALAELQAAGVTARLVRLDLPPQIEVPAGQVEVRATVGGVRDLFTPFPLAIEISVDGRVFRRLTVMAQVEAYAPVLVAARDIVANRRVREDDVTIEVRRLNRPFTHYLRDEKQLRGMSASRLIAKGEAITTDALFSEIVVRPGDQVRIEGESDRVRVVVLGEARASGRIGDRITVKNLQSGALLQAVVVDEGVVSVRF
jgi:flagella basal body P-ring formation protein FlgA